MRGAGGAGAVAAVGAGERTRSAIASLISWWSGSGGRGIGAHEDRVGDGDDLVDG